jgi:dipeptidyl aminopeptidase/acylaminoacyl peptidase
VLTASQDHTARIWDAENGAPFFEPLQHADRVLDACFSPDGLHVATASKDNTARVWDARNGKLLGHPLRHLRTVEAVSFSPDGRRVVTASRDHTARIWDVVTSEPLTAPLEHDEGVLQVSFSPDSRRIVTAAADATARIWDAETGLSLSPPLRHNGPVRNAQFSPDARRVATATLAPDAAHPNLASFPRRHQTSQAGYLRLPRQLPGWPWVRTGRPRLSPKMRSKLSSGVSLRSLTQTPLLAWRNGSSRTATPERSLPSRAESVSEYVQRRIDENTPTGLEEAVRLDPTNGVALARLAEALLPSDPAGDPRRAAEAAHLAKLALRFGPDLPGGRRVLERVSPRD